jgi:hypothetical protein
MAKAPIEIRSLARSHTASALKTLAGIMSDKTANASARVSAAQALLDRGWGKPEQKIDADVKHSFVDFLKSLDERTGPIASEGTVEAVPGAAAQIRH